MALSPTSSHGAATTVATDTIWDAKGDTVAATGADAASRVAVGTDGTVYTADAASAAGVKWAAPSTGALTLLSTTTNVGGAQFDVASISGSYNDLVLMLIGRSAETGTNDVPTFRFNNDGGANYYAERTIANSNTGSASEQRATVGGSLGRVPAVSALASSFGIINILVPGYAATSWLKQILFESFALEATTAGGMYQYTGGGFWNSTAAVTRIQINSGASAGFAAGSVLRIYGRL